MSRRGTILLAVGMVILGLVLGFVAGGVTTGFLARRAMVRATGRFAAPGFYGSQRMMPFYAQPAMPHRMPFYGQGRGSGGAPFYAPGRGLGHAPFNQRRLPSRRAPAANFANGARVTSVESNSAADKAGLVAGDVITTVAGTKIDARHSFASLLQSHKPGDKIDLGITRGGQAMTISVTLGASLQNSNTAYLGIRYGPAPGAQQQKPKFR